MRGEFEVFGLVWVDFNIDIFVSRDAHCRYGVDGVCVFLPGFATAKPIYTMVFVHYAWMLGVSVIVYVGHFVVDASG